TQARSHALAVTRVRRFDRLVLWGRDRARAEQLRAELASTLDLPIDVEAEGAAAAREADVICTVSGAGTPILFRDWVRPGTHLNIVGSSSLGPVEVDGALVRDA